MALHLPNFFLAGAPKTGTTSLYRYLSQHPQIYMSPVKEPSYFASEVRISGFAEPYREAALQNSESVRHALKYPPQGDLPQGIVSEWEDYCKLFSAAGDAIAIGEASVCYLWSATAAKNIRAEIPGARIIAILRDPAERAFSQYLHNARDGVVRGSFREHIQQAAKRTKSEFEPLYPFLENGMYYQQVKRYLDFFPPEQIRIFLYEEAWREPCQWLIEVFTFLGVDPAFEPDLSRKELEQSAPRSVRANYFLTKSGATSRLRGMLPAELRSRARGLLFKPAGSAAMEPEDRRFLRDYYREDVKKLTGLLNRDLGAWLK